MLQRRRFTAALVLIAWLAAACGHRSGTERVNARPEQVRPENAPAVEARLVAVDVFDTDPETLARVMARHEPAIKAALQAGIAADPKQLAAEIRADGEYAYVEPSLVTYDDRHAAYLTIDIVDQRDAGRRMAFTPSPKGSYPDPAGLIAAWQAYETEVFELLRRGQLRPPPKNCPAFHCLGDPRQPELQNLAMAFSAVPDHADELTTILRDDGRTLYRATAAFLLAYLEDGNAVVADLLPALRDSRALVRNNALRVLAEIALHHPEIAIPIEPVIEALNYPSTTDRNKAAATLQRLLDRPDGATLHRRVTRDAGTVLLAMLQLAQPNNHDYAYKILKQISGQSYAERDYAAWREWLTRASTE